MSKDGKRSGDKHFYKTKHRKLHTDQYNTLKKTEDDMMKEKHIVV